jgi:hypothetical protein
MTQPPPALPRSLEPWFPRLAGASAALSAITTLLLWALPRAYEAPADFEASIALHENAAYLARYWTNFVHIFLALAGYAGAALVLARRSLGLAALGLLFFVLWGTSELLGVSTILFAVNRTWRAGWADADAATRETYRTLLAGFDAVWDSVFFLLLVAFLLGSLCHGLAAWRGAGLERVVGALLLLAVPLTLAIMVSGYGGPAWPGSLVEWAYPVLQPLSRALLGVWLWRSAPRTDASAAPGPAPSS